MAENNRNWGNQSSQDWDQNRSRYNQSDEDRNRENYGGYGNVGYGSDYNQNRGMRGSYGSSGMGGSDQRRYGGAYSSDYGSQYEGDYGQSSYSGSRQERQGDWQGSGSMSGQTGGHGDWNRKQGFGGSDYRGRSDWESREMGYGGTSGSPYGGSNYGSRYDTSGGYGQDENRGSYGGGYTGASGYSSDRGYSGRREQDYGNMGSNRDRGWWDRTKDEVSSWFGGNESERQGMHRGKGPKDYRRSEDRIREDVCDRLSDDDRIDASNVQVQIQGDEVILSGTVEDREQKRRAEDLVERVSGVRNVENRLRVSHKGENTQGTTTATTRTTGTETSGTQTGTIR